MNRIVMVITSGEHRVYHEINNSRTFIATFDNFDDAWVRAYKERHSRSVTHGLDIERIENNVGPQ